MADFQPLTTRFVCRGLNVAAPEDAMPEGKFSVLENMRSVVEGTIEPRAGTVAVATTPGETQVHTVDRLNDTTPFNGGVPTLRVGGAGPSLYGGPPTPGTSLTVLDTGYSGEPLTVLAAQPVGTPQPWLYVANRQRQRKLNTLGQVYETGIAPPRTAPTAILERPEITIIETFEYPDGVVTWLAAGAPASAPQQTMRLDTTLGGILYDEPGATTGNALLWPISMLHIGIGTVLWVSFTEDVVVQDVKIAIVETTIQDILYDDGVGPGLCTIQPAGNLSTALMHVADPGFTGIFTPETRIFPSEHGQAATPADIDPAALHEPTSRQAFVVDGLVLIDGEPVRILSVSRGRDEIMSFRCRTTDVHSAGDSLVGQPACRVHLLVPHAIGDPVQTRGLRTFLTPSARDVEKKIPIVGGVRSGVPFFTVLPTDPTGTVDYLSTVVEAKAQLIAESVSFVGPCGSYAIVERTATLLSGIGCGVMTQPSTPYCSGNDIYRVMFPNGQVYQVLVDPSLVAGVEGANTPAWTFLGIESDLTRYVPVGNDPVHPTGPHLDLSKVGTRMTQPDDELHVSLKVDKLDAVTEVRVYFDCDAEQNDYTRNVFFYAFSANDLIKAVQAFNATATTPLIDEGKSTALPNDQIRRYYLGGPTQLSLGNNQWIELRWRVKDMIRVGTDPTRSLRHVQGMQILIQASPLFETISMEVDSCWIGGGFAIDAGGSGAPYVYTARYRSRETGVTSRPGPLSRGGVVPRRQRVRLTNPVSPDPQTDRIDYYRFGAGLPATGVYVGSAPNTVGEVFFDDLPDAAVTGSDRPAFREFQPWPTAEVPRSGTVRVVGSAVQWLSGDQFDARWPPGMGILINGTFCHLYQQPSSSTFLELVESMGSLPDTSFEIPNPTVMGTPLPTLWGPFEGFYFAVGDPVNPGLLKWTVGNNPDVTSDVNDLYVTSPSTPLMNGYVWDNAAFVWSTEDLYRILPDFTQPNQFTTNVLPCGRGLWNRWAFCLTPLGAAFLAKDGIYLTNAGSPAVSLTDADLYPLFPHDGVPGVSIRGMDPPDMTSMQRLRLTYADGLLYFDYLTTAGDPRTLVCDLDPVRWYLDRYPVAARTHTAERGAGVHHVLLGRTDGTISEYRHRTGDDGAAISYRFRPSAVDGGNPRAEKLVGDLVLDLDPDGGAGATVTPGLDTFDRTLPATTVGAGDDGRDQYIIDINDGDGVLAKNIGIEVVGADAVAVPTFYLWETSVIPKGEITGQRSTDWDDAGYFGAKFMQGVLIEADTQGSPRTVEVEYDGGQLGATLTVTGAPGQLETAHSFATPFIAHLLRLSPTGGEWLHYRHRWVWEPSPELAAYWITQPTTHDFPGYGHVERVLIAHMSQVDFDLIVTADGQSQTYRIPSSRNAFLKTEVLQRPNKGKVYQYALRTVDGSERMRIFLKDCEVRAKPWGHPDPYQILRPFGDLSREFGGARI